MSVSFSGGGGSVPFSGGVLTTPVTYYDDSGSWLKEANFDKESNWFKQTDGNNSSYYYRTTQNSFQFSLETNTGGGYSALTISATGIQYPDGSVQNKASAIPYAILFDENYVNTY